MTEEEYSIAYDEDLMADDEYQHLCELGADALVGARTYAEFYANNDWGGRSVDDPDVRRYYGIERDIAYEQADKVLSIVLPIVKDTSKC